MEAFSFFLPTGTQIVDDFDISHLAEDREYCFVGHTSQDCTKLARDLVGHTIAGTPIEEIRDGRLERAAAFKRTLQRANRLLGSIAIYGGVLVTRPGTTRSLYVFTREAGTGKERVYIHDMTGPEINQERLARAITGLY